VSDKSADCRKLFELTVVLVDKIIDDVEDDFFGGDKDETNVVFKASAD